jgi:hypothetical protein
LRLRRIAGEGARAPSKKMSSSSRLNHYGNA